MPRGRLMPSDQRSALALLSSRSRLVEVRGRSLRSAPDRNQTAEGRQRSCRKLLQRRLRR